MDSSDTPVRGLMLHDKQKILLPRISDLETNTLENHKLRMDSYSYLNLIVKRKVLLYRSKLYLLLQIIN